MDELKLLVEMVAGLPSMALWVIAFFFAYKVICIGSLYGIIRFGIDKLHSWLTSGNSVFKRIVQVESRIRDIAIDNAFDDLLYQLRRIRGKGVHIGSEYIHSKSVEWLREAIDEKEAKDSETKRKAVA